MSSGRVFFFVIVFTSVFISVYAKPQKKSFEPELAVTKLAPVERKTGKPSEGVYYSLFVRAFADGNGDGIGDFKGLTKKLDYLNDGDDTTTDDLGVTGLWLLPIFESPSYHGYDVDDYYSINPEYGTMNDFETFIIECKKRGISVILDITFNHSSVYNEWFKASKNPESPYRSWYRWISDEDTDQPALGYTGPYSLKQKALGGAVWNIDLRNRGLDSHGKEMFYYYAGVFGSQMPDFNLDEKAVRKEFKKVLKFWLDKGVSGFRFDAVAHAYNANEVKPGTETISKAIDFWKEISDYVSSEKPDSYCVGEVWEPAATRAKYMGALQSNFHFDLGTLISQIINNQEANDRNNEPDNEDPSTYNGYARSLEGQYAMYAKNNPNYIDAPFLSNHDQVRSASALKNKPEKIKLAADMYILLEGVPFVYYGEEIAMKSGADDPSKRTPLVWNKPGKDRFESSWNEGGPYRNSTVYNKKTVPISEQQSNPSSILNHYKRVIRIKTAHPALFKGRLRAEGVGSAVVESYFMDCDEETAFVLHNVSSIRTEVVFLPKDAVGMSLVYAGNSGVVLLGERLSIPPMTSVVLARNNIVQEKIIGQKEISDPAVKK